MELKALSRGDVVALVREKLGLDESTQTLSEEFIASAIRYAASIVCPTSPRNLISAVVGALNSVTDDSDLREKCRGVLENVIANGDLVESEDVASQTGYRLIYLAPPFFVRVNETKAMALGIVPDGIDPIPSGLEVELRGPVRIVGSGSGEPIAQTLKLAGFEELSYKSWAKAPDRVSCAELVSRFDKLIDRQQECGDVDGLSVLRGDAPNHWYRGRWGDQARLTGRFVARRPQKYGADIWCYVELDQGRSSRLVDLPIGRTAERGCDQAWRLQCALDAFHGDPQQYKLTRLSSDDTGVTVHIPPPAWLLRRWESMGTRYSDNVFEFIFNSRDATREVQLLEQELWMVHSKEQE